MAIFKIFYSWQSDLPSKKTRNFIRSCIDDAIDLAEDSETFEAARDEATKNTTGSPNIVTTLYSKIDDCDLFIADVSLCYSEDQKGIKKSPNPNVMLELGYAVKTLGWERVICLCNADFGSNYPFDIAQNRMTSFSLEGKNAKEEKERISRIIFKNIRDLRKLPFRAKNGNSAFIIGSYDFSGKSVVKELRPLKIGDNESYKLHNAELLYESNKLVEGIKKIPLKDVKTEKELQSKDGRKAKANDHMEIKSSSHLLGDIYQASENIVQISNVSEFKQRIKNYLHIDVDDSFFYVGNLRETVSFLNFNSSPSFKGTDEEKKKYDLLQKLSYNLTLLEVRGLYLDTFKGMLFFPIAVKNSSNVADANIRITLRVDDGEIVEPDANLLTSNLEGFQGHLCRNDDDDSDIGVIAELFLPEIDDNIQLDEGNNSVVYPRPNNFSAFGQCEKTEDDYADELKDYIAMSYGSNFYQFEVDSLRPGECKWLETGLLLKPADSRIKIHYSILSDKSRGDLEGELTYLQKSK